MRRRKSGDTWPKLQLPLGIAIGSVITAGILPLAFSTLFVGSSGFFVDLSAFPFLWFLVVPGGLVAGLLARGKKRGALAGAITTLFGFLSLLIAVPILTSVRLFSFMQIVLLNALLLGLLLLPALVAGGIGGYLRNKGSNGASRAKEEDVLEKTVL